MVRSQITQDMHDAMQYINTLKVVMVVYLWTSEHLHVKLSPPGMHWRIEVRVGFPAEPQEGNS